MHRILILAAALLPPVGGCLPINVNRLEYRIQLSSPALAGW